MSIQGSSNKNISTICKMEAFKDEAGLRKFRVTINGDEVTKVKAANKAQNIANAFHDIKLNVPYMLGMLTPEQVKKHKVNIVGSSSYDNAELVFGIDLSDDFIFSYLNAKMVRELDAEDNLSALLNNVYNVRENVALLLGLLTVEDLEARKIPLLVEIKNGNA